MTAKQPVIGIEDSLLILSGCSFTYGMGVSDSLTYPYLLQSALKNHKVINAGVPAYGSLQTLLLLQKLLENDIRPKTLIYHYLDFHPERNVLSRSFKQLLLEESRLGKGAKDKLRRRARFPYGESSKDSLRLIVRYAELDNKNRFYFLRSWSALINQLEYVYTQFYKEEKNAQKITELALLEIQKHCQQNKIDFIIAIMKEDNPSVPSIQPFCQQHQITTVDLRLDYTDTQLLNAPYDGHPNAKAHQLFADKMVQFLQNSGHSF